ncbi:MAG: 1-(5-phosphoribosyl)-5-[(5-phosphoribosylamino)methylideneamino]imidazole-4-carboxamide isomerase [Rhodospirillaceae bacterium]|nr:1-(5-phosphoribosyl)-5-[(5-phosphoribosylamino)methylideneamino]imidazole-4-carboxamide isomerase [Rhodospirillaceae bacterium]
MILYPAIDLKDGACVRLRRGDMDQATVFNLDPGAQAKQFTDAGCDWIHVVDLDGAFEGKPENGAAVDAILDAVDVPVQLGGGIRSLDTAADWLERGVRRIVFGTVAVKDPDMVIAACRLWPDQVAVGIDARGGFVAVEGWAEQSTLAVVDLAGRFEDAGVAAIVYTDIDRDGMMQGVNVEETASLAEKTTIPVIASGGIASLEDLRALKARGGIAGAISGRALYDGRLDLSAALTELKAM